MKKLIICLALGLCLIAKTSAVRYEVGWLDPISWPGLAWKPSQFILGVDGRFWYEPGKWITAPVGFMSKPSGKGWKYQWIETRWCPIPGGYSYQPGGWYWCIGSSDK